MQADARKRIALFLACAAVLLAAGYGVGYSRAHDQFYASESLLANEVVSLDLNNRLLHCFNTNQPAELRRELLTQIHKQSTYVETLAADCRDPGSRRDGGTERAQRPAGARRGDARARCARRHPALNLGQSAAVAAPLRNAATAARSSVKNSLPL